MLVATHESTPAAEALLASILRDDAQTLAPEYPLVFGEGPAGRLVTIEEGGHPVAGLAILERTLRCDSQRLPVGLIGSVATDPAHRGRGHATTALEEAERELKAAGCAFAMLWADEPEFYTSRGWVPVGTEVDHCLPPEIAPLLPDSTLVRPANPGDAPGLHALYCAHTTRVERDQDETRRLLAAPGMTTLVLERDGVPCAYACEGRGADLSGAIHEWAGAPLDVLGVVRAHLERVQHPLVLMSPCTARDVFRYLQVLGITGELHELGMGKLVSPEAAAQALRTACPGISVTPTANGVAVQGPAGTADLDATQTLFALVAPRGLREMVSAIEEVTGTSLDGLPLAPFCWGLDSI